MISFDNVELYLIFGVAEGLAFELGKRICPDSHHIKQGVSSPESQSNIVIVMSTTKPGNSPSLSNPFRRIPFPNSIYISKSDWIGNLAWRNNLTILFNLRFGLDYWISIGICVLFNLWLLADLLIHKPSLLR